MLHVPVWWGLRHERQQQGDVFLVRPSEHQRAPGYAAGPPHGVRLYGRGGQHAAGGQPADAAAEGTQQEDGQQLDGGPEVLLVTTETGSQHRVQGRVVLHQRGTLVEEKRYGDTVADS